MKKRATRFRATALALVVCSLLTTGCHNASLRPAQMVADSISGFSGQQGANGWSYGYWDRTADTDDRYTQATDFQLLRHFGSDPINQLSGHPEFTTGQLWTLQDGLYYTSLWAEGGHPNGTMKLGSHAQVEHWAVRRWVSTANGPVPSAATLARSCRGERNGEVVATRSLSWTIRRCFPPPWTIAARITQSTPRSTSAHWSISSSVRVRA